VADVVLVNLKTGMSSSILAGKIDTGADFTVVPLPVVEALAVPTRGHGWLISADGKRTLLPMFYLALLMEGFEVRGVRCFGMDRRNVLVGRNVLNNFVLTLDGKKEIFSLTR